MSDTSTAPRDGSTATIRQEPSAATSLSTGAAIVIVADYFVKVRYGLEVPGYVEVALGAILMGVSHGIQTVALWAADVRRAPHPILPPKATP